LNGVKTLMLKTVSVVIPTYNRRDYLLKTLLSFNNQSNNSFEVIVVDDGSDYNLSDTISSLQLNYPVTYYYINKQGRAGARNFGINNSEGEIILFFDDHSQPYPTLIDKHIKSHYKLPMYGGFRGRIEYISEYLDVVEYIKPSFFTNLHHFLFRNSAIVNFGTHNLSIKRSILGKAGAFDEDFKLYGAEDQEFGIRIRKAGYKLGYIPTALTCNIKIEKNEEEILHRAIESGKMAALLIKKHPEYMGQLGVNFFNKLRYLNKRNLEIYKLFTGGEYSKVSSMNFRKLKFILYYFSLLENLGKICVSISGFS